jgi:hypothetical protein
MPTASPSPSSSPVYLVSNTMTVKSVPMLQFNLTSPDIIILPKGLCHLPLYLLILLTLSAGVQCLL